VISVSFSPSTMGDGLALQSFLPAYGTCESAHAADVAIEV
jgi:hypothetical protein